MTTTTKPHSGHVGGLQRHSVGDAYPLIVSCREDEYRNGSYYVWHCTGEELRSFRYWNGQSDAASEAAHSYANRDGLHSFDIAKRLISRECSVSLYGVDYKRSDGYLVSIPIFTRCCPGGRLDIARVTRWVDTVKTCLPIIGEDFACFGSWVDSHTGDIHFDANKRIDNLETALDVARDFGQLAVWDLSANSEVRV